MFLVHKNGLLIKKKSKQVPVCVGKNEVQFSIKSCQLTKKYIILLCTKYIYKNKLKS
jgi:hypothetical protein